MSLHGPLSPSGEAVCFTWNTTVEAVIHVADRTLRLMNKADVSRETYIVACGQLGRGCGCGSGMGGEREREREYVPADEILFQGKCLHKRTGTRTRVMDWSVAVADRGAPHVVGGTAYPPGPQLLTRSSDFTPHVSRETQAPTIRQAQDSGDRRGPFIQEATIMRDQRNKVALHVKG